MLSLSSRPALQAITGDNKSSCNIFFLAQGLLPPTYLFCVVFSIALHTPLDDEAREANGPPYAAKGPGGLGSLDCEQYLPTLNIGKTPARPSHARRTSPLLPSVSNDSITSK